MGSDMIGGVLSWKATEEWRQTMPLNPDQNRVIGVNAEQMLNLGVAHCALGKCAECNTPYLAEFADALVACGYCGNEFMLDPGDRPKTPLPILTP